MFPITQAVDDEEASDSPGVPRASSTSFRNAAGSSISERSSASKENYVN